MNYGIYYVFITALISSYEDMIIAALVKGGLQVSPLAESNQVTIAHEDSACAIITLRIDTDLENSYELHKKIQEILIGMRIVYYSLVVTESTDCCWNVSQLKLTKALPPPPIVNVKKSGSGLN